MPASSWNQNKPPTRKNKSETTIDKSYLWIQIHACLGFNIVDVATYQRLKHCRQVGFSLGLMARCLILQFNYYSLNLKSGKKIRSLSMSKDIFDQQPPQKVRLPNTLRMD